MLSQSQVRGEQQCWSGQALPSLLVWNSSQFFLWISPIQFLIISMYRSVHTTFFFFFFFWGSTLVVVKLPQLNCYNFTSFCAIIGGVNHLITWAKRGEERLWKLITDDCEETGDVLLYSYSNFEERDNQLLSPRIFLVEFTPDNY